MNNKISRFISDSLKLIRSNISSKKRVILLLRKLESRILSLYLALTEHGKIDVSYFQCFDWPSGAIRYLKTDLNSSWGLHEIEWTPYTYGNRKYKTNKKVQSFGEM